MLPTMILQPSELATFDTDLNSANPLPQLATEPRVAFADVLKMGAKLTLETTIADGQLLPPGGNELPALAANQMGTLVSGDEAGAGAPVGLLPLLPLPAPTGSAPVTASTSSTLQVAVPGLPYSGGNGATETALQQALHGPVQGKSTADMADAGRTTAAATLRHSPVGLVDIGPSLEAAERQLTTALREQQAAPIATLADNKLADDQQRLAAKLLSADGVTEQLARALGRGAPADNGENNAQRDFKPPFGTPLQVSTPAPQAGSTAKLESLLLQDAQPFTQQSGTAPAQAATLPPTPGAAGGATVASQSIDVPVRDAAWGEQIGQRVQLMASNRLQTAEIRLTPAELGPLRIQVAVDDGAASVTFHAASAVTRDAIEQALPRLREMLAESGLTLGQTDIGEQGVQHGGREGSDDAPAVTHAAADPADDPDGEATSGQHRRTIESSGLVDMFA